MRCARLRLHERCKPKVSPARKPDRPRRFCQQRMVDPGHEEDPRWVDLLDRFYCNSNNDTIQTLDKIQNQQHEDLFLSVQNLKFNGDNPERKRPKTCFKYKALSDGKQHRMFVKQIVEEEEDTKQCPSQLTCYYFDDYVKYIVNNEQSPPPSEKSSILFHSNSKGKENKSVQVEASNKGSKEGNDIKKHRKPIDDNAKKGGSKELNKTVKHEPADMTLEDTKVAYHKSGKRKCLTISRAQSPETVQVIRVDVVCAYSRSSTASDVEPSRKQSDADTRNTLKSRNMKASHFSDKYLLTNTTKTLDEKVSGGAKVTLLCKTFMLSRRSTPMKPQTTKTNKSKNKINL